MKRFFKFLFNLLSAFIAVNLVYIFMLPKVDWEFSKTKEAHDFKKANFRILVFGNSTAMDGVNTEILTNKLGPSYNFSIGGASLRTNYIQLSAYLAENSTPEKVLLCLSSAHPNYARANDVNPIIGYYYYSDSVNRWNLMNIPLFRFRWLVVGNLKKLISPIHRSAVIVNGQLRIKKTIPDNSIISNNLNICSDTSFYNKNLYEYMWKIAELCKRKGIQFEVFELPCWKDVQNNCSDTILKRNYHSYSLNINIHNLNNYNICNSMLDSQKDWLSINHLNYYGSIKVTEKMVDILSK